MTTRCPHRPRCFTLAVSALMPLMATAPAPAQATRFESIAPKGSFVVFSARDVHGTVERWATTPAAQLLQAPELAKVTAEAEAESKKESEEAFRDMGIDATEMPWPGPGGVALFTDRNEDLDAAQLGVLLWADYGTRADDAAKVFDGLIRFMEKEQKKTFEQVEVTGGLKATRIELPPEEDEGDGQPQPPRRRRGMDGIDELLATPEAMFFLRRGSEFFLASTPAALEDAMEAAAGKGRDSVATTDDWRGLSSMLGDQEMSLMLFTAPVQELLAPLYIGPAASVPVVMRDLFGDIRGWGIAMGDGGGGDAYFGMTYAAFVPGEKRGLVALLSDATAVSNPPSALGDDAVTFQRLNLRFGGIMQMLEDLVASLPDNEADAISPTLQQFGPGMTKAFGGLGPEICGASRKAPDGKDGMRSVMVVRCSDEKATNALLATMLPSAGMMPRDFQGQIIYGGDMADMEVGVGAGALVMGTSTEVQQAMRSGADPSSKSIGDLPLYRRCLGSITAGPVVGWGFIDLPTVLDENRKQILALQDGLPIVGDDEEDDGETGAADVLFSQSGSDVWMSAMEKVDLKVLQRYIGPLVWDLRSDSKGIGGSAKLLGPSAEAAGAVPPSSGAPKSAK